MKKFMLVLALGALAACAPAPGSNPSDTQDFVLSGDGALVATGDFKTLSFANVMQNSIKSNCLGCHSAPMDKGGYQSRNL